MLYSEVIAVIFLRSVQNSCVYKCTV